MSCHRPTIFLGMHWTQEQVALQSTTAMIGIFAPTLSDGKTGRSKFCAGSMLAKVPVHFHRKDSGSALRSRSSPNWQRRKNRGTQVNRVEPEYRQVVLTRLICKYCFRRLWRLTVLILANQRIPALCFPHRGQRIQLGKYRRSWCRWLPHANRWEIPCPRIL